jgi:hypothetical protein
VKLKLKQDKKVLILKQKDSFYIPFAERQKKAKRGNYKLKMKRPRRNLF